MSNEEMNKKMEFIVEHQARFAAEMEILREAQAAETKLRNDQYQMLSDATLGVIDIVGSLARTQLSADGQIHSLVEAQARTDENIQRLTERLNIFVNIVERYISGNGGSESHA